VIPTQLSQADALALFDSLPAVVDPTEMLGDWRGHELFCGHPLEGLLSACRWWGKRFVDAEHVYPQIFARADGSTFSTNPARMPMSPWLSRRPEWLIRLIFRVAYPYVHSEKSSAHLAMAEYHGQPGVAMVYDKLPIIDHFRRIDANQLLAIMDMAADNSGKSLFFTLEKTAG
jgi:hypothetical protein